MKIRLFNFIDNEVRVSVTENNEPLFCASDITKILGYNNGAQAIAFNCTQKGIYKLDTLTKGGNQSLTYITEGNLYRLIARSNKPEAEKFEEWVFDEVLPAIRKNGGYIAASKTESPEEIMAKALIVANETIERIKAKNEAELSAERAKSALLDEITQHQAKELKESAPKVEYFDKVMQSEALIPTNVIAKELGMSAVTLNLKLKEREILYKSGDTWVLYHQHQNKGYTGTKTASFTDSKGNTQSHVHTYWTEKGRKFIHDVMAKSVRLEPCRSHENN